jgi:hypothetical protein
MAVLSGSPRDHSVGGAKSSARALAASNAVALIRQIVRTCFFVIIVLHFLAISVVPVARSQRRWD